MHFLLIFAYKEIPSYIAVQDWILKIGVLASLGSCNETWSSNYLISNVCI